MTTTEERSFITRAYQLADADQEWGDASNGVLWVGQYDTGRVLAIDHQGNRTLYTFDPNENTDHGDESDCRAAVELEGHQWSDMLATYNQRAYPVCDECTTWVANADDSSHDEHCTTCSSESHCGQRLSRYGTFEADDYVDVETNQTSSVSDCFGCGDIGFHQGFILRDI